GNRVQITWTEFGGPSVAPTRERGFGTTLLEHILDSYQGKVEIDFRPEGVVCDISFAFSHPEPPVDAARLSTPHFAFHRNLGKDVPPRSTELPPSRSQRG